ncbi:TPA: hypothetical protein ACOXWE_004591 [Salmonella enterica]
MTLTKNVLAALLAVALLSGCDNNRTTEEVFTAAKQEAVSAPDPWLALKSFRNKIGNYGRESYVFYATDDQQERFDKRLIAEEEIVKAALEKDSAPALIFLFSDDAEGDDSLLAWEMKKQHKFMNRQALRLVDVAEKADTRPENGELFYLAGQVLQNGTYVNQNTERAIAFHLRAWQAGYNRSSAALVDIYKFLKDAPRAYFWEIRNRNASPSEKMTGEQILNIQRLASDPKRPNL